MQMVRPAFTSCGNLNSISFVIQVPQRDMGCMLLQSTVMASLRRRLRRTTSSGRRRTCYTRVKTSAGPLKGSSALLQHTAGSASSQWSTPSGAPRAIPVVLCCAPAVTGSATAQPTSTAGSTSSRVTQRHWALASSSWARTRMAWALMLQSFRVRTALSFLQACL